MAEHHTTTGTGHDDMPDHELYGTTAGNPTAAYTDATQGSGSSTGEATRRDKAERKAQGDRMMKIGIGAFVVLAAGGAAYKFAPHFMNKPTVPQEAASQAMTAPTPASSVAPSSLSGAVSPTDNNAPPVTTPAALPDVGASLTAASAPSETMSPLGASSAAAPSLSAQQSPSLGAPSAPAAASAPIVLATPLSAASTPALNPAAPSLSAPSAPSISAPAASAPIDASTQAGLTRALSQLTDRLESLSTTIQNATTEQNKKIDDLASRVERLEQGRPARHHAPSTSAVATATAPAVASATAPVDASASAPAATVASETPAVVAKPAAKPAVRHHVVRAHKRVAPVVAADSDASESRVKKSSDDGVLFDKSAPKSDRHDIADGAATTERQFTLQATIPGRLWIKNSDGSSSTFGVGDTLPDGSRVQGIDADHYSVRTSHGVLR